MKIIKTFLTPNGLNLGKYIPSRRNIFEKLELPQINPTIYRLHLKGKNVKDIFGNIYIFGNLVDGNEYYELIAQDGQTKKYPLYSLAVQMFAWELVN